MESVFSLIAGIISIIPVLLILLHGGMGPTFRAFVPKEIIFLSFFAIIGIFFGIIGVKSTQKRLAIIGIILSIIGLIGLILLLMLWWSVRISGY
ncbi:MAG: hypothetical protein QMC93_03530 [Patescibacteria group bacterium]|nr:hypothetical protein [Patescibacteria group bacterium]